MEERNDDVEERQDKPRSVCIPLLEEEVKIFDQITTQLPISERSLAQLKFYHPDKYQKLCEVFGICQECDKVEQGKLAT